MARFPGSDFRLIAPDLPGFCLAQFNPGTRFQTRFFTSWIDGFLDALGLDKAFLVVHSVAAIVGITYAASRSERLYGLVLANTPELFMPEAAKPGGLIEDCFDSLDVKSAKDWYNSIRRLFYKKPVIPPVIREYNHHVFAKNLPKTHQFLPF